MAKISDRKIAHIIKTLRRTGGCVKSACQSIGISRPTFYKWVNTNKNLAIALEESRHEMIIDVEQALFDKAKSGDVAACIFLLTNIKPDKYRHVSKINGSNIESELSGMTNEELLKQIAEMANRLGIEAPKFGGDAGDVEDADYEDLEENEG